jgi:hypothetical protein
MRFISHCVYVYGEAYQLRLPVPENHPNAPRWSVSFNVREFDSREAALAEAQSFREEWGQHLWGKLWPLLLAALDENSIRFRFATNVVGHVGVYKARQKVSYAYVAAWRTGPPGQRKTQRRYYSINKYGEETALRLAIEERERGIIEDFYSRI